MITLSLKNPDDKILLNSTKMRSLVSTPGSTNIISDRVHCNPLSLLASGSRCHTADYLKEMKDAEDSVLCPMYSLSKPPPWVHVFSKSIANSSLCTQCAALASVDAYCPSVFNCRLCRARNKRRKQDRLLREIVVPPTQVKMSTTEIDSEIIVFDGGGHMSPPIRPPDGIRWRSIPVRDLHVENKISGDIGLSFPRIGGTSPFIPLPRGISLEIISHVGLPAIYDALRDCEKMR